MVLEVNEENASAPVDGLEHDFERLFAEEAPRVWRTIYAFTAGRRDIAEEAVAEAFARALAHRNGIRDPLGWIYRTAFRLAKEELRRERRSVPQEPRPSDEPARIGQLIFALRQLSPNQRAAIVLRYEVELGVIVAEDEMRAAIEARYGAGAVRLFPALTPVDA